uniref:PDZ domain-containing protein n=1 Tax=Astatotilapia calliptera TaxID=8154 RepID=A0AAX7UT62_ASTCA
MKKHTMGIYVINREDGQNGHYDDIGIFVEGEIVMDNIGSLAQACALMLGVIYALNLKVLMGFDGEKLSPKVFGSETLVQPSFVLCYVSIEHFNFQ